MTAGAVVMVGPVTGSGCSHLQSLELIDRAEQPLV